MQSHSPMLTVNKNNYCRRMTAADVMDEGELRSLLTDSVAYSWLQGPSFQCNPPPPHHAVTLCVGRAAQTETYIGLISFSQAKRLRDKAVHGSAPQAIVVIDGDALHDENAKALPGP